MRADWHARPERRFAGGWLAGVLSGVLLGVIEGFRPGSAAPAVITVALAVGALLGVTEGAVLALAAVLARRIRGGGRGWLLDRRMLAEAAVVAALTGLLVGVAPASLRPLDLERIPAGLATGVATFGVAWLGKAWLARRWYFHGTAGGITAGTVLSLACLASGLGLGVLTECGPGTALAVIALQAAWFFAPPPLLERAQRPFATPLRCIGLVALSVLALWLAGLGEAGAISATPRPQIAWNALGDVLGGRGDGWFTGGPVARND